MMSVRAGTEPTSEVCAASVAQSRAALKVYDTTERLYDEHGLYGDDFLTEIECGDSTTLTITNVFDVPILSSGIVTVVDDEDTPTLISPFLTDSIEPGEQLSVTLRTTGATENNCEADIRAVVAPVDDLAADAGITPAGDVAQASTDPTVWLPELWPASERAKKAKSEAILVAEVEDIHSPDVFGTADLFNESNSLDLMLVSSEFCGMLVHKGTPGAPGELAFVAEDLHFTIGHSISLGLYRRGSDGLWRYLGRTINATSVPDATCTLLADARDPKQNV